MAPAAHKRYETLLVSFERGRKVPIVILTRLSDPSQSPVGTPRFVQIVELVDLIPPAQHEAMISLFPRLLALTQIQRYVLKCVAAHCWTHRGRIPYHPSTNHQAAVALDLASESWRLLTRTPARKPTYALTRLGNAVAHRILHVVPVAQDRAREREFDRMRALMRHDLRTLTALALDDVDA
jgi:hypothetical protein